ncbi:TPA: hypothetical protein L9493_001010 [Klebsiella variicola subsp. variicola]|nr:hypothetical protein [Klebsiella variicola subsp. variicola]HBS3663201.1 hypothetical protein [Klebsiella variicola subsp. variicola]
MATTDTQQTAQFAAQAAVSAAEAKQYLLSIEQPVIDISESVADAQNAAAAAEMARDQAQGISTSLVQTIDSQLSEQETQFESQMTTQQSSFESSQSERASSFEEKSNEFESRFSSQLSIQESTFSESQTDKENRFQQFLLSSGYVFLGDYENGPFQFSARNQYIRYDNEYYRLNAATDVGFTTTGTDATSFANDVTHFVLMDGDTLRQNLGSGEEGMGGDLVAANPYHSVSEILSRTKTYSDYGKSLPINGYDTAFYASVFADKAVDNDLYLPGKLNLAANLYGTSNTAALLNLLGNNSDSFRAQIVSGDSSVLSGYGMAEDLLMYGGIVGRAAITTTSPTFTASTITITDGANLSKLKTGSVIKTSDLYWGKVVSISGNVITVDGWYKAKVAGTPSGTSAELNHITKTYFENQVMWIPSTYTGTKVVGGEWDFMLASPNVTEKNGWDMVVHDASLYSMDTAFRVRSAATSIGWATGLRVEDVSFAGLYIADGSSGLHPSLGSVVDASSNPTGILFQGWNSSRSILWRYAGSTVYPAAISPYGFLMKGGRTSSSAVSGTSVTLDFASYYVNNNSAAFSLVLPSANLVAGQEIEFYIFGTNPVTVSCLSSSVNVNNVSSYSFTPTKTYTRAVARWSGSSWYFFA